MKKNIGLERVRQRFARRFPDVKHGSLSGNYEQDMAYLKRVFEDDDLIQFQTLKTRNGEADSACIVFCDGLVNTEVIDAHIIRPLQQAEGTDTDVQLLMQGLFQVGGTQKENRLDEIIKGITYGDTLFLMRGMAEGILFSTKKFNARSIAEPEGEKVLSGPREGFNEVLMTNLSLVRRRLRTERLKMRYYQVGEKTGTQLCIAYLDGVVEPRVLAALYRRLSDVNIDGILDANYLNELIRDDPWSPFRSIGYTERPDVVAAKLLEGRVALFVDGTPVVLTLPYLFIENFQSSEDYYLSYYYTSFSRLLRILGFFLTMAVPAIYIAIVAYHQEMLPAPLLISIAAERQSVPLPAAVEALIMLVVFEILRETALRMQANVGQALGIVGALVVGQAAVEAALVAAPMIIIVAVTGITSLLVPKMNASTLLIRFGMLLLASFLGFFGVTIGSALVLAHILSLRSFGVWQFSLGDVSAQTLKDTAVRAPWFYMLRRPGIARDSVRQRNKRGMGG